MPSEFSFIQIFVSSVLERPISSLKVTGYRLLGIILSSSTEFWGPHLTERVEQLQCKKPFFQGTCFQPIGLKAPKLSQLGETSSWLACLQAEDMPWSSYSCFQTYGEWRQEGLKAVPSPFHHTGLLLLHEEELLSGVLFLHHLLTLLGFHTVPSFKECLLAPGGRGWVWALWVLPSRTALFIGPHCAWPGRRFCRVTKVWEGADEWVGLGLTGTTRHRRRGH